VNLELFYVLIALIMVFFFYRRNLLFLLQDKKETMQMLLIFVIVVCLVYVISDYLLDVVPNNIRNTKQVNPLTEFNDVSKKA
jgi:hypothetical protein